MLLLYIILQHPKRIFLSEPSGFLLADTGGHYKEGTTDITRTVVMGPTTEEEKKYFTAVLTGNSEIWELPDFFMLYRCKPGYSGETAVVGNGRGF